MKGLRVRLTNDRRYVWTVLEDNGTTLRLRHDATGVQLTADRSEVSDRYEPGIGWVPTKIAA